MLTPENSYPSGKRLFRPPILHFTEPTSRKTPSSYFSCSLNFRIRLLRIWIYELRLKSSLISLSSHYASLIFLFFFFLHLLLMVLTSSREKRLKYKGWKRERERESKPENWNLRKEAGFPERRGMKIRRRKPSVGGRRKLFNGWSVMFPPEDVNYWSSVCSGKEEK